MIIKHFKLSDNVITGLHVLQLRKQMLCKRREHKELALDIYRPYYRRLKKKIAYRSRLIKKKMSLWSNTSTQVQARWFYIV